LVHFWMKHVLEKKIITVSTDYFCFKYSLI
jgi:hypothetical protein